MTITLLLTNDWLLWLLSIAAKELSQLVAMKSKPNHKIKCCEKYVFFISCSVSDDEDVQCSVDTSGQHWTCFSGDSTFRCSVNSSGISCVDEQHCPYAEESKQIHITVYVMTEHFLVENYSKTFFLSDIGETSPHYFLKNVFARNFPFQLITLSSSLFLNSETWHGEGQSGK